MRRTYLSFMSAVAVAGTSRAATFWLIEIQARRRPADESRRR
jgi:hypothetical protein